MLRFRYLLSFGILLGGPLMVGSAQAGVVCPERLCSDPSDPSCVVTKYGLHQPDSLLKEVDPLITVKINRGGPGDPVGGLTSADFEGSVAYGRDNGRPGCDPIGNEVACRCGPEDGHIAVFGTLIVEELANCDPFDDTSEGWGSAGGPGCPAVTASPFDTPEHFRTAAAQVIATQPVIGFDPVTGPISTELHISVAPVGSACGAGRRLPNPDPNAPAGSTRIEWDTYGSPVARPSFICCNSPDAPLNICNTIADVGVPRYPAVPTLAGTGGPFNAFPDWVFVSGRLSNWEVDPDHQLVNQRYGVCENNRLTPCDCGVGSACLGPQLEIAANPCPGLDADPGTAGIQPDACDIDDFVCEVNRTTACDCTDYACSAMPVAGTETEENPCAGLDADPDTAGLQPDRCDVREFGWRLDPASRLDPENDGSLNPNICPGAMYRYRGFPEQFCSLPAVYESDGDPGADCSVVNFGNTFRPDEDCNGIDDTTEGPNPSGDLCPFFTETNLTGDSDGNGRGDDCECGDANRDGFVNVSDILGVNDLIFNDPGAGTGFGESNDPLFPSEGYKRLWAPLADATNDPPQDSTPDNLNDPNFLWDTGGDIDVRDILVINSQIFGGRGSCARYPVCGDGSVDGAAAETCDDGNTDSGDGCDNACEVEFGFTCTGQPSVCTL